MLLRFLEWEIIETIEAYVRTGKSLDVHERIGDDQWGVYQRGMQCLARISAPEVAFRVRPPEGAKRLLDIGGGHGSYAAAFCRRYPQLSATILDLPQAVESAAPLLASEGMGDRIVHWVGNAVSEDLGQATWDLIFMSHFVHHFDETTNKELMRRVNRALRPGGLLVVLDVLRASSPDASDQTGALLDLYFAITSRSGTWSHSEIAGWFNQAGLNFRRKISLLSTPGLTVLMAVKPISRGDISGSAAVSPPT
jgi:SAM-dependent methyltransferase